MKIDGRHVRKHSSIGGAGSHYLSFIFLTAFAFLNMIIGIVVKVLEEEHRAEEAAAKESEFGGPEPTLYEIKQQLDELRDLPKKENS